MGRDLRNAKAKARDEFLESTKGRNLISTGIKGGQDCKYSRNRVELAWCAGWDAAKRTEQEIDGGV